MNQILTTKFNNKIKYRQFKIFFIISIIAILIFISLYLYYKFQLQQDKIYSTNVSKNYQIYKLFAENSTPNKFYNDSDILGTINIPKLNISYPFFYGINYDLLKISPCRFYGEMPNKKDNLCIAGHNYEDNRFFSNLSVLNKNDLIFIEDNYNNTFRYAVYDKFEITEDEISSIMKSTHTRQELTLLTCNNKNNKRIVVKGYVL